MTIDANNPLGLKASMLSGSMLTGATAAPTGSVAFDTMQNGISAASSYINSVAAAGVQTLGGYLYRFITDTGRKAASSTASYASFLQNQGLSGCCQSSFPDKIGNRTGMQTIIAGQSRVESGRAPSSSDLEAGVLQDLGLGKSQYINRPQLSPDVLAMVDAAAAKYGLSPDSVEIVARIESGGNQSLVSSAGAVGVMQLTSGVAAKYGLDPTNAAQNIDMGAHLLADLSVQFNGDDLAVAAAYNRGPNAASVRYFAQTGDPTQLPTETQTYIKLMKAAGFGPVTVVSSTGH